MASSPPGSPVGPPSRPMSAMMRTPRSGSRMSVNSKTGGSKASDEDSKTSVRVAVRVRPPLKPTDPGFDLIPQRFQRSMVHVTSATNISVDSPQGRKLFVFDRVFGEDVGQDGIWGYINDSVNSFVQGYNVSILAYGQSGSGKSYTMGTSGPQDYNAKEALGVIPRAATTLFEKLDGPKAPTNNRNSTSGLRAPVRYSVNSLTSAAKVEKTWTLKATYVEIYNEHLRDLLVPEGQHERGVVSIREDTKGHILLTGLHTMDINSVDDLMNALNFGSSIRQTNSTDQNAQSSRSHAVFSLNLVQRKNRVTPSPDKRMSVPLEAMNGGETVTVDSKLHFVDLAGSERLKNTGAMGERAREGISINAGLASLGKVISQLSSRNAGSHVSYRDSKLTRLLQDSLGGNAITYMIACVTPAEFHLSETLNTIQYAQRARAIQSKPRIQQVSDDSDKQAIIDRLKAEVSFLRDQIRNTSSRDGPSQLSSERTERSNGREIELQNQLLDTQENYTALSQRHAKLISEMSKAREGELANENSLEHSLGESATERLKRSNSFAEAVEQVVLEYEKTIQSLEQSLSSTRGTLASTETVLLEKETKCAYVETVNQQLQARIQKLMDREASTESYLHDLEAKLDGHANGEEKNSTVVMELRKEIARIRENEAACEDYISTLEERLAESDQDAEIMQREIERLEHVVERQRSVGKLDNLLHELDSIQKDGKPIDEDRTIVNGKGTQSKRQSLAMRRAQKDIILENGEYSHSRHDQVLSPALSEAQGPADHGESIEEEDESIDTPEVSSETIQIPIEEKQIPPSPAQTKFVADKLENVTQELLDLRIEHETVTTEYDILSARYEEALRTLAELQDAVDEARHIPTARELSDSPQVSPTVAGQTSFLADARVNELRDGGHISSSRSLSSELSSAGELPSGMETSDAEVAIKKSESEDVVNGAHSDETIAAEVESLRRLANEQEEAQAILTEKYAQLHEQHMETLDVVEELKTEIQKVRHNPPPSPSRSSTPVIRRKSSQNVMIIDRAHRSFASLRNIASENFEDKQDVMQNFELNLNTAMHELHARSERVQELEADISAVRKEMEMKMTIISGLTRERTSMRSPSAMDMSVVSTMRDQIVESENQMRLMQETHRAREKELMAEVESLRTALSKGPVAVEQTDSASNDLSHVQEEKIASLESELADWENRHQAALTSMQESEQKLLATITDLEAQISSSSKAVEDANHTEDYAEYRAKHQDLVETLQKEIDTHKSAIAANSSHVAQLEEAHFLTREQLDEMTKSKELSDLEVNSHKALVSRLEQQIAEHETVVKAHQDGLKLLHANHAKELDDIKTTTTADHEALIADLTANHNKNRQALESDLAHARNELTNVAAQVAVALGMEVSVETLEDKIKDLMTQHDSLLARVNKAESLQEQVGELSTQHTQVVEELEIVKTELATLLASTTEGARLKDKHSSVIDHLSILKKEMAELENKNKKSSRLVEELEDQLASNFDQHQVANNRLSTLQAERDARLDEAHAAQMRAQTELAALREEYNALQAKFDEVQPSVRPARSNSQVRKTASVTSLPSPPPAIPLPPLPGSLNGAVSSTAANGATSPNSGTRPPSKDLAAFQIQEDQEARIRTIEKHLFAEKQLTSTLEEALTDLERQSKAVKVDADAWKRRAGELETEIDTLKKELKDKERGREENRWSLNQVEEERKKRRDAEIARAHLEERMNAINKKKKKNSLNCF